MKGLVIKNTGSWYQVKTENATLFDCKIKGNLRLQGIRSTNPIAVGDFVNFELSDSKTGLINSILDRKNYIIRKASNLSKQSHILAANLDLVALIVTINYPETSTVFIDRFLAVCEAYRIPACLVFNKTDCYSAEETEYLDALADLYEYIGYPSFKVSGLKPESLHDLTAFLTGKTTLLSGNSGVGKSTLINIISSVSITKTGKISEYHNKGMHTTTFSEMFELENGGYVIDTPGIKGFGTVEMKKEEIGHYFKEIFVFAQDCRFSDCTHIHEPGCAVLAAVQETKISQSRYNSYLSVLSDCVAGKYR